MRVSTTTVLAMGAAICALANAESALRGRALDVTDKADSRSSAFTDTFTTTPDSFGAPEEFEGIYLVGLIAGFVTTAIAMIFAVVVILRDEKLRHKRFKEDVELAKKRLMTKHGCSQQDIVLYEAEF